MLEKWRAHLGFSDKWAAYHDDDTELDENPLLQDNIDEDPTEIQHTTENTAGNDQKSSWTTIDSLSHSFIPSLEGLRGIAVSLTIFCHCATGPRDMRDASGSAGVTIFFVLSGFLITGVLIRLKHKSTNGYSYLFRFYSDRFFRLGPALITLLIPNYLIHIYLKHDMKSVTKYFLLAFFYLSNLTSLWDNPGNGGPLPHMWSLACEEQYYIIWSIGLSAILALSIRFRLAVLSSMIAFSMFVRLWLGMYPGSFWGFDYLYSLLPNVYKMLLGSSLRLLPLPPFLFYKVGSYIGLLGFILGLGLTLLPQPNYAIYAPGWSHAPRALMQYSDLIVAISTSLILCSVSDEKNNNVILERPGLRFIGRISYAWYLWQIPIIKLNGSVYRGWPAVGDSAVAFIAAMLSTLWVEEPINRAYKGYKARRNSTDETTTATSSA